MAARGTAVAATLIATGLATMLAMMTACGDNSSSGPTSDTSVAEDVSVPGEPDLGDAAVWWIDPSDNLIPATQSFTARVSRLACNDGDTGAVLDPIVEVGDSEIVITFTVEPIPPGTHTCPSNDAVEHLVQLGEPIAGRVLVDGACRSDEARTTSFCVDGSQRWPPGAVSG